MTIDFLTSNVVLIGYKNHEKDRVPVLKVCITLYLPLRKINNNPHSCAISGTRSKFLSLFYSKVPGGIVFQIKGMAGRATRLP